MADLLINGNIAEVDGAYYPVRLQWVPRIGELIDLTSFIDMASSDPPRHFYEVVQVVHQVHDVTDKTNPPSNGHHFVTVYVKPSHDRLLQ